MKLRTRGALGTMLVGSLVVAAGLLAAGPASAAALTPANEINGGDYTMTLTPDQRIGHLDEFGDETDSALVWGPDQVDVSTGCPEGYRSSSRTFIVTPAGLETEIATARTNATAIGWGLDGQKITLTGGLYASRFNITNATSLPTGLNSFVVTCDATAPGAFDLPVIGDSKYFAVTIQVDRAAESWKVVEGSEPPVRTATVTTLAASGTTATSTTLTATVAPAAATGTVTFKKDGAPIDAPATVTNGTASITAAQLTGATNYSFTAEYSGDATHAASTSTAVAVTTLPAVPPVDSATPEVVVNVPAVADSGPTGLTISTKPGAVTLQSNAPRADGQVWSAEGSLGEVTVNDNRQDDTKGAWTLNGSSSEFVSGTDKIAPAALGWTPTKVSGAGEAGAAAQSLATGQKLASGTASASANVKTTVDAELELKVPATAPAGSYKATLTLTLI